jgi:hypothetical protein
MILINLAHPLTAAQRAQIEALTQQKISRLVEPAVHFDVEAPFAGQIAALVDELGLTPAEWQQEPLLVAPPSLNFAAAGLLAELHGRCGYFPPIVRLRPVAGSLPPRYEVAEIMNLQAMRDDARQRRR